MLNLDPLSHALNRRLVQYAASQHIFCPLCGHILDRKSTVVISAGNTTKVACSACYDIALAPIIKPEVLARCEVLDGRVLWKRAARRRNQPTNGS